METIDTSAAVELVSTVQGFYDSCLRDSRKTQKSIDNAMAKADLDDDSKPKGWRLRLFELAQGANSFAQFKGYCDQAAKNVAGDKPKVWTQTQSDIKGAWDTNDLNPSDYPTLEALRTAKIAANKVKADAEKQAEQDKTPELVIPVKLAAQVQAINALSAACHETDADTYSGILETAINAMMEARDKQAIAAVA